jgi:hypothetical protein
MVVQIDPSGTVQGDPCKQDSTREGEPGDDRNQACNAGCDDQGQSYAIEWSEHRARLVLT